MVHLVSESSLTPTGHGFDSWSGSVREVTDQCFSHTLMFLTLCLSQINKHILGLRIDKQTNKQIIKSNQSCLSCQSNCFMNRCVCRCIHLAGCICTRMYQMHTYIHIHTCILNPFGLRLTTVVLLFFKKGAEAIRGERGNSSAR